MIIIITIYRHLWVVEHVLDNCKLLTDSNGEPSQDDLEINMCVKETGAVITQDREYSDN